MRLLDRYIGKAVLISIGIVLFVLVGLFTFFTFIEEVEDLDNQQYTLWQALQYVLFQIPRYIYDLYPTSALLGSLVGLGALANHSELTVIRAAGVSVLRIAWAVLKVGLILMVIAILIGETLAPYGEQTANNLRSLAQTGQHQLFNSRQGFWARDGQTFIHIGLILPDGGFGGIRLYELDEQQKIKKLINAKKAYYIDKQWQLQSVEIITFTTQHIQRTFKEKILWNAVLSPTLVKIVVIKPDKLSSWGLYQYIRYLKQNNRRTMEYELALWNRLTYPLVTVTMILLAIPYVFGSLRTVAIGQRLLIGALLGVGFFMLNQTVGNMGLVYHWNPIISALVPPLIFLTLAILFIRRVI